MLHKLALSAVVALVPGFALAAADGASGPASTDTHVTETKTDTVVKSDTKDAAVKTDVKAGGEVKAKAEHHGVGHKASAKVKTEKKDGKDKS